MNRRPERPAPEEVISSLLFGVAVPIPRRLFVLSQKYWELFCDIIHPTHAKSVEPRVNPESVGAIVKVFDPANI